MSATGRITEKFDPRNYGKIRQASGITWDRKAAHKEAKRLRDKAYQAWLNRGYTVMRDTEQYTDRQYSEEAITIYRLTRTEDPVCNPGEQPIRNFKNQANWR